MRGVYFGLKDVCGLMGLEPTETNCYRVSRELRRRLKKAAGALDHHVIKHGTTYRFTKSTLRCIFPELFDRKDEVEKELARRFREIERRLDEMGERLERSEGVGRARDDVLADAIRDVRTAVANLSRRPAA